MQLLIVSAALDHEAIVSLHFTSNSAVWSHAGGRGQASHFDPNRSTDVSKCCSFAISDVGSVAWCRHLDMRLCNGSAVAALKLWENFFFDVGDPPWPPEVAPTNRSIFDILQAP